MVWTNILLYILIGLLGFFFGMVAPLMHISKAFRDTDREMSAECGTHSSNWCNGAYWFRAHFYRNFYGGKK